MIEDIKKLINSIAAKVSSDYKFYTYEVSVPNNKLEYQVIFSDLWNGSVYNQEVVITQLALKTSAYSYENHIEFILVAGADVLKHTIDQAKNAAAVLHILDTQEEHKLKPTSDIASYAPPKQTKIVEVKTIDDMYAEGARDSKPKKSKKSNKLGETTLTAELIKAADELALKQAAEIFNQDNPFFKYIKSNENLTMSSPKTNKVLYGISEPSLADLYVKYSPELLGEASTTNKPPKSPKE